MNIIKKIFCSIFSIGFKFIKKCVLIIFCIALFISWPLCFLIMKIKNKKGDDYR